MSVNASFMMFLSVFGVFTFFSLTASAIYHLFFGIRRYKIKHVASISNSGNQQILLVV